MTTKYTFIQFTLQVLYNRDMENEQPPEIIYYATIQFQDGGIESPHFLVFDQLAEGVMTIKDHYKELDRDIARLVMKEALFTNTKVLPEETHILVPANDNGVDDDFRDPAEHQMMVMEAEEGNTEEAILSLLPYEQENDALLCRAFYMGPFLKAKDEQEFVDKLIENPFPVSQPLDFVWLYRPTGEWKEVKI